MLAVYEFYEYIVMGKFVIVFILVGFSISCVLFGEKKEFLYLVQYYINTLDNVLEDISFYGTASTNKCSH